ncbi:MAG: alpha/beta fold hydrolase [Actinobacteria bacterium]|nr:alpha/beta fold hydrolase [Actinomycetota bacterium]
MVEYRSHRRHRGHQLGHLFCARHVGRSAQPRIPTRHRVNGTFASGALTLQRYLSLGPARGAARPAVLLCHGFPIGPQDARHSASSFPELIDRIANELGWSGMTFTFRGCGNSDGDFSMQGWIEDTRAAIDHLVAETQPTQVWLLGTNTGASVALCVAADDPRANQHRNCPRVMTKTMSTAGDYMKLCAAVRTPAFPAQFDEWSRELRRFRPSEAARRFAPRPLLLMHGDEDELVPESDSRTLAEAHGSAELHVIPGGGHRLRHDPRAIAMLIGWLDRQR